VIRAIMKSSERINLHIYGSSMKHESRILKETGTLSENHIFDRIFIIGVGSGGLDETEEIDKVRSIWRVPIKLNLQQKQIGQSTLSYLIWLYSIVNRFRKSNVVCINCHSWTALPIGIVFKLIKSSRMVYDTHELETEAMHSRGKRRLLSKVMELCCIHFCDSVITVGDFIAMWYRDKYRLSNVHIVRNLPLRENKDSVIGQDLRRVMGINDDDKLFIYIGGLTKGRGIELLLRVFTRLPASTHIGFMGYGEMESLIIDHQRRYSNIHFVTAVSPDAVIPSLRGADVGISLIENTCLSYYHCLPNKLFEYIQAGVPSIVSDFPEMGTIIDDTGCGWKVPVNEEAVYSLVAHLSMADIREKKENALRSHDRYVWENEEPKLLQVYADMDLK